jgi:hypothetical protein
VEGIDHADNEQHRWPFHGESTMTRKHVTKRTLFAGTMATLAVASLAAATLAYTNPQIDRPM